MSEMDKGERTRMAQKPLRRQGKGPACSTAAVEQQLRTVFEVARVLATEHDPELCLPKVLSCLTNAFPSADAGLILLYDPEERSLRVKAAVGYVVPAIQRLRIAPGESLTGQVFQSGRGELYATPEEVSEAMGSLSPDNRRIFQEAAVGMLQPLSAVCVPLHARDARIGVLALHSLHRAGAFTRADLDFLQRISDLVGLAIEESRLREELEQARALNEANRLKAELLSTLAHEMRTPLTSIKGYSTALLMEDATFSPETQREFLRIIDEECDVLESLIHDLLESSIIDAGLLRLEMQPVMIPRLVDEIVADVARRSKDHRFVVDIRGTLPIVDADPKRLAQVLRNLLDNAVKYSPKGSLVVVGGEVRDGEVVISVADQGEGIAPEYLNRLFEKFFRIKSGLGRHTVGSGLGLPIARTIVESHGGRIWAESQIGRGSTFYFTIPLRSVEQQDVKQEE